MTIPTDEDLSVGTPIPAGRGNLRMVAINRSSLKMLSAASQHPWQVHVELVR